MTAHRKTSAQKSVTRKQAVWVIVGAIVALLAGLNAGSNDNHTSQVPAGTQCHQTVYIDGKAYVDNYLVGDGVTCP